MKINGITVPTCLNSQQMMISVCCVSGKFLGLKCARGQKSALSHGYSADVLAKIMEK